MVRDCTEIVGYRVQDGCKAIGNSVIITMDCNVMFGLHNQYYMTLGPQSDPVAHWGEGEGSPAWLPRTYIYHPVTQNLNFGYIPHVHTGFGGILVAAPIFEALRKWWYRACSFAELNTIRLDGWLKKVLPSIWCTI